MMLDGQFCNSPHLWVLMSSRRVVHANLPPIPRIDPPLGPGLAAERPLSLLQSMKLSSVLSDSRNRPELRVQDRTPPDLQRVSLLLPPCALQQASQPVASSLSLLLLASTPRRTALPGPCHAPGVDGWMMI